MTAFLAFPPAKRLEGAVRVPPSKSATNRALILAALSESPVVLGGPLESDDTFALRRCLVSLGARFEDIPGAVRVSGPLRGGSGITVLDAADSGTAARFLLAVAAATPGRFRVRGSARLSERPMGELAAALRELGAPVVEEGLPGCLPMLVEGGRPIGGKVTVDASRSSQFLSALLLLGAAAASIEVAAAGPVSSAPYVAVTIEALRAFGHRVSGEGPWRVERGGNGADHTYHVPGDFSSAIPLLAAAGAAGGEIRLEGLAWPSPDADALAVPVLIRMGLEIVRDREGFIARANPGDLRGVDVPGSDFPDAVPSLAALAAFCPGTTRFRGIGQLRYKESDRLRSLSRLVGAAGGGAHAVEEDDDLSISGFTDGETTGRPPVRLPTFRDHRIAMSAGILSVGRAGILIEDPDCVAKSYPAFFRDLDRLCRR